MAQTARTLLKWFVSLGVGGLFVWLAFDEWPIDRLLEGGLRIEAGYLATDDWRVPVVTLGLYFLTLVCMHVFRVWRWQPLMKPLANVDFWTLNRVCSVGFMAVFLLPMRLGELVRPALISTEVKVRRTPALATIVVERVVDGVMVAGFLAVALVFMPRANTGSFLEIRLATYLTLLIFGVAVAVLAVMFAFRQQVADGVRVLTTRLSGRAWAVRLGGFVDRFLLGLSIFPDVPNVLWFLFLSFFYWFSNGIGLYLLASGFEVMTPDGWGSFGIPLLGAFAMMAAIVVGMMIPNAPANVGSFWYFLLKPLELYGVQPGNPAALAYALTVWTLQLLQLLIFGGWFIVRGQVSFRRAFAIGGAFQGEEDPAT
jgi:hypothetical protein